MSANEQTVRVDAVRRAGHKRYKIPVLGNVKAFGLVRLDFKDLIDLISKGAVKHINEKPVPLGKQIEIREKRGGRKPPVRGKHAMRASASDGQSRTPQMPDTLFENAFFGGVIYRQADVYLGYLYKAHNAV